MHKYKLMNKKKALMRINTRMSKAWDGMREIVVVTDFNIYVFLKKYKFIDSS